MKRIDLIFVDAGGGHRSTVEALYQCLKTSQPALEPQRFNLEEIDLIASMDIFKNITGCSALSSIT